MEHALVRAAGKPYRLSKVLALLLGGAIFAPVLFRPDSALFPPWLGSAFAASALFGALAVAWRTGRLGGWFIIAFLVVIVLAALAAIFS